MGSVNGVIVLVLLFCFSLLKMEEIAQGAMDFNLPLIKENRELVSSMNGGLSSPSVLVCNSSWNIEGATTGCEKFSYPVISVMQRLNEEEGIVSMTVSTRST